MHGHGVLAAKQPRGASCATHQDARSPRRFTSNKRILRDREQQVASALGQLVATALLPTVFVQSKISKGWAVTGHLPMLTESKGTSRYHLVRLCLQQYIAFVLKGCVALYLPVPLIA